MPGPPLIVCVGDTIVVRVVNLLKTETTSIHWHGIKTGIEHHQIAMLYYPSRLPGDSQYGTPYMDGVPGVTQCPISPGATFVYKWEAKGRVVNVVLQPKCLIEIEIV